MGRRILFNRDLSSGGGIDHRSRRPRFEGTSRRCRERRGRRQHASPCRTTASTVAFQSDRSPGGIFLMEYRWLERPSRDGSPANGLPRVVESRRRTSLVYAQHDGWLYLVGANGTDVTRWAEGGLGVAWRPGS